MRSATALAVEIPFGIDAQVDHQIPLPIPGVRPVLPVPVERGPRPGAPLRERTSRFLQAVVEVLVGERPARQLAGWLAPDVYRQLERRATLGARLTSGRRSSARIVSVHVSMIEPTIAEVSGRFVHHRRSRAVAVRLELAPDHRGQPGWRCTALEWA
ncbi:Rv3235 family protein [Aeromicrobium sp. Leaf350]|uniref:Rv3235 family protein n=1 Tax=Aeromicrobium sp. Leaf350 TaxID=2876565 RepID=UPI001E43A572|nr:Rv3235 family protein [Aeromicrobium sp. Leaf350]